MDVPYGVKELIGKLKQDKIAQSALLIDLFSF